jgi:hypothetical protein
VGETDDRSSEIEMMQVVKPETDESDILQCVETANIEQESRPRIRWQTGKLPQQSKTVTRLTVEQKLALHRVRPDLNIIPDWISRYQNEQGGGSLTPQQLVAFITAALVLVSALLLLLLSED